VEALFAEKLLVTNHFWRVGYSPEADEGVLNWLKRLNNEEYVF